MAAIAAIRLGTSDEKGVLRAEWDGEEWTYENLPRPEAHEEVLWELTQDLAHLEFGKTQAMIFAKFVGVEPPYNHRHWAWINKEIMELHVERGLGIIVLPISNDDLLLLT